MSSVKLTRLKVLSFNILAEQFIDYSDLSADYPGIPIRELKEDNRLPKIFNFLKQADADVMLLQEVNNKVYKLLRDSFEKKYTIYALARHKTQEALQKGNTYGNLIMVRDGIFAKGKQTVYNVPILGTAFAILETSVEKSKVLIVNIHLDSDPGESKRRREIKVLMELLKPKLSTHTIILSGDFNTSNANTHKKFNKLRSVVSTAKGTYLADDPMIDWIYVSNAIILSGNVLKPARASPVTPLKKYGSDHYPVIGNIAINHLA